MKKNKPEVILFIGGARSGKSDASVKLAVQYGTHIVYIATGTPGDDEMKERIEVHKKTRPASWITVEAETGVGIQLSYVEADVDAVILDCLTMLTSNILLAGGKQVSEASCVKKISEELDFLLAECRKKRASCIIVTNEVGLGIVPAYQSARVYRDILGRVNKYIAAKADKVLFMIAGLAVDVKKLGVNPGDN
jgi:adenosylcobinamide kinase / adenosylcobinamide-phosphate guanylyltransferase